MTSIFKAGARALGTGSVALLLAGTAMAQAADTAAVDSASSQIVVRDAATGALRAANAAEAKALAVDRGNTSLRLNTQPRAHFSGARGLRLSDAFMNHAVIARLADGSVVEQCFHTPEEAAVAHKAIAAAQTPAALPTE